MSPRERMRRGWRTCAGGGDAGKPADTNASIDALVSQPEAAAKTKLHECSVSRAEAAAKTKLHECSLVSRAEAAADLHVGRPEKGSIDPVSQPVAAVTGSQTIKMHKCILIGRPDAQNCVSQPEAAAIRKEPAPVKRMREHAEALRRLVEAFESTDGPDPVPPPPPRRGWIKRILGRS